MRTFSSPLAAEFRTGAIFSYRLERTERCSQTFCVCAHQFLIRSRWLIFLLSPDSDLKENEAFTRKAARCDPASALSDASTSSIRTVNESATLPFAFFDVALQIGMKILV